MCGEGENIMTYAQSNRPKCDLLTILLALLLGVTVVGPTAAATEFSVAGVGVEAVPATYFGTCPGVITFKAKIQANAAGRVKYTWIRSDGATGPVEYIDFVEAGVLHVETTWTLGDASVLPRYEGWEQIKILSPAEMVSNKATFTLKCKRSNKNQSDNNIQPTAWAGKGDFAQARALRPERSYPGLAAFLGIPESTLARADDATRDSRTIPGVVANGTISFSSTPATGGSRYSGFLGIASRQASTRSILTSMSKSEPGHQPEGSESSPDINAVDVFPPKGRREI